MERLREAAEMALEILQDIHSGNMTPLAEDAWNEAIKALRAAIESPTPEPVAWMCSDEELLHKGYSRFSKTCVGAWNIPVYTAPPQRKPLTDEEILKMWDDTRNDPIAPSVFCLIACVRHVERAHGIGGAHGE